MPIRTVLLLLALATTASAASVFQEPFPIDAGRQLFTSAASSMAVGDFNGDSWPDVALSHIDGRLVVALNTTGGPGPFAASLITAAPAMPSLVAGHLNNDGKLDLVGLGGSTFRTLMGNGDGTFTPGPTTSASGYLSVGLLALGDVNADGKLDVVAASKDFSGFSTVVATYLGAGNGQFSFGDQEEINGPAQSLSLGHLNGDANIDVVVGGQYARAFLTGAGGALTYTWNRYVNGPVALAQIDAGSTLDLVAAGEDNVEIYAGNGNGTFTIDPVATHHAPGLRQVLCADVTNDGVLDIVGAGAFSLTVLRGLGGGNFAPAVGSATGKDMEIAVRDFDRDTKQDVVGVGGMGFNDLVLIRGNGDGTFGIDRAYRASSPHYNQSSFNGVVTDFNGDNRADLVTLDVRTGDERFLTVVFNDGTGKLTNAVSTSIGAAAVTAFRVGRIDSGAQPDVVVIREGDPATATTYFGQPGGTFTLGATTPVPGPGAEFAGDSMGLADITGDGIDDLLFFAAFHAGNSDGSFGSAVPVIGTQAVGDLDGNGTLDLVNNGLVALNMGGGAFSGFQAIPDFTGEHVAALGDFDGDDVLDLLSIEENLLKVRKGAGDGTFGAPLVLLTDTTFVFDYDTVAADFDGDGNLDALVAGRSLFLGDGHGRFRDLQFIPGGWRKPGVGDFDGNGSPDVAVFHTSEMRLHFSRLQPAPTVVSGTTLASNIVDAEYARPFRLTADVYGNVVPATGVVVFALEGVTYSIRRLNSQLASTTLMTSILERAFPVGTHHFIATYTGNMAYQPSSSVTLVQEVVRAATSLSMSPNSPSTYGGSTVLLFTHTAPKASDLPGPARVFRLLENGVEIVQNVTWSDVPLSDLEQVRVDGMNAGDHALTIEFEGDENYEPSSVSFTHTVNKRTPFISYASLPAAPDAGPVTIEATVTHSAEAPTTGTVTFILETTIIGTDALENGVARLTTTLPAGTHSITLRYNGDANNSPNKQAYTLTVYAGPWGTPIVLQATATGNNVDVRWTPVHSVGSYTLYRKTSHAAPWQSLLLHTTRFVDTMPANTTYMYYVVARHQSSPQTTTTSNADLATSVHFGDDPLVPGIPFKSPHISQLRTAVDSVRAFAGLAPYPFTDGTPAPGLPVRAAHVIELRAAVSEARNAIAMPVTFTDPVLTPGVTPSRALHLQELRAAVR